MLADYSTLQPRQGLPATASNASSCDAPTWTIAARTAPCPGQTLMHASRCAEDLGFRSPAFRPPSTVAREFSTPKHWVDCLAAPPHPSRPTLRRAHTSTNGIMAEWRPGILYRICGRPRFPIDGYDPDAMNELLVLPRRSTPELLIGGGCIREPESSNRMTMAGSLQM
ncbi:hypothetical protein RJ55_03130 [Drechmeria coniospora]|nr:hypothetical protein RJ55_03130 [Drechmeria coniospora]